MVNGPIWTIIDYEWTYGKCIPAKEQMWRALYCYRLEDRKREKYDQKPLLNKLGLSEKQLQYVTNSDSGCGLILFNDVVIPITDRYPTDTKTFKIMNTKPEEVDEPAGTAVKQGDDNNGTEEAE